MNKKLRFSFHAVVILPIVCLLAFSGCSSTEGTVENHWETINLLKSIEPGVGARPEWERYLATASRRSTWVGVMFLHNRARLKDGRLSRADSGKAAKDLNRRKQRKFEQKLAKVRRLPSEKLFFRTRSLPSLDSPRDFSPPRRATKDRNSRAPR